MTTRCRAAVLITMLALGSIGCEPGSSPTGGGSTGTGPQSQLGRTAEMGRDLAADIAARDAAIGTAAGQITGDGLVQVPGLDFSVPAGWNQQSPANAMRLAQFDAGGALVVVSQAGGSVQANVERWLGQVVDFNGQPSTDSDTRRRTVAGYDTTVVESFGALLEGAMFGTPTRKEGSGLLGAVIDTGDVKTFVKMTGPTDAIENQAEAFERFLDSAQRP